MAREPALQNEIGNAEEEWSFVGLNAGLLLVGDHEEQSEDNDGDEAD